MKINKPIVIAIFLLVSLLLAVGILLKASYDRSTENQRLDEIKEQKHIRAVSRIGLVGAVDREYNVIGVSTPLGPPVEVVPPPATPKLSDEDCRIFEKLTDLREAHLARTGVSDKAVKYLSGLRKLRILRLPRTAVSDEGVKSLRNLTQLETLDLGFTKITDAGVASLSDLKELRKLSLYETNVTDAGLAALANLKNLEQLQLSVNQMSQLGIGHLKALSNLTEVYIFDHGQLTEKELAEIESSLPNCKIRDFAFPGEVPWPSWAETSPPFFLRLNDNGETIEILDPT